MDYTPIYFWVIGNKVKNKTNTYEEGKRDRRSTKAVKCQELGNLGKETWDFFVQFLCLFCKIETLKNLMLNKDANKYSLNFSY